jgi:DNA-binding response OmpR family regulator
MLTANSGEQHVTTGFGVGADDYVVKPFRREELVARVRRILERTYGVQAAAPATATKPAPGAPGAITTVTAAKSQTDQR